MRSSSATKACRSGGGTGQWHPAPEASEMAVVAHLRELRPGTRSSSGRDHERDAPLDLAQGGLTGRGRERSGFGASSAQNLERRLAVEDLLRRRCRS